MFYPQTALDVARILTLMADPANARSEPTDSDLEGDFDVWFDGGAAKHDTGVSVYHFADGARAVTGSSALFAVLIRYADGRIVDVAQKHRDSLHPAALVGLDD